MKIKDFEFMTSIQKLQALLKELNRILKECARYETEYNEIYDFLEKCKNPENISDENYVNVVRKVAQLNMNYSKITKLRDELEETKLFIKNVKYELSN